MSTKRKMKKMSTKRIKRKVLRPAYSGSSSSEEENVEVDPVIVKRRTMKKSKSRDKKKVVTNATTTKLGTVASDSITASTFATSGTGGGGGGGDGDDVPSKKKPRNRTKKVGVSAITASSEAVAKLPGGDAACTEYHLDPNMLKVGDRISNVETGRIITIGDDYVDVVTDGWVRITKAVLRSTFRSPDQCVEDVFCSRTAIMQVLRGQVGSHLFKVRFQKKPKKGQAEGDWREMYCVMAKDGINNDFGYSIVWEQVVDDPKTTTYQRRQVNHNTMSDLWFNGKHYIVKTR